MPRVELHFVEKDFLGYPVGMLSGVYDKHTTSQSDSNIIWTRINGSHKLPFNIDSRKVHSKFIECEIGASICLQSIDMKYCNCGKKDCSYNEEFKRIITDFVNNKHKIKTTSQKLDNIYEFMLSMGFEPTERQGIYKHRYFVNEHYIEFDLSACALEKWAVMQHIFVKLLSVGENLKAKEICNVLGVAQHSI